MNRIETPPRREPARAVVLRRQAEMSWHMSAGLLAACGAVAALIAAVAA